MGLYISQFMRERTKLERAWYVLRTCSAAVVYMEYKNSYSLFVHDVVSTMRWISRYSDS